MEHKLVMLLCRQIAVTKYRRQKNIVFIVFVENRHYKLNALLICR